MIWNSINDHNDSNRKFVCILKTLNNWLKTINVNTVVDTKDTHVLYFKLCTFNTQLL